MYNPPLVEEAKEYILLYAILEVVFGHHPAFSSIIDLDSPRWQHNISPSEHILVVEFDA